MQKVRGVEFSPLYDNLLYPPKPASAVIPEWYKNTESYLMKDKVALQGQGFATIKKCVPVFDAITAGYIIFSSTDIQVQRINNESQFSFPTGSQIETHINLQAFLHPASNGERFPKFMNPWVIKTPKGYSTLFTQPFHREAPFTILDGVVDTDTYHNSVNFPFVLNDPSWEGLIPAGTPLAQIIPFKRESFQMSLKAKNDEAVNKTRAILNSQFFDKYRNHFWSRKEYR